MHDADVAYRSSGRVAVMHAFLWTWGAMRTLGGCSRDGCEPRTSYGRDKQAVGFQKRSLIYIASENM